MSSIGQTAQVTLRLPKDMYEMNKIGVPHSFTYVLSPLEMGLIIAIGMIVVAGLCLFLAIRMFIDYRAGMWSWKYLWQMLGLIIFLFLFISVPLAGILVVASVYLLVTVTAFHDLSSALHDGTSLVKKLSLHGAISVLTGGLIWILWCMHVSWRYIPKFGQ